ncbi:hypothetical protein BC941DRAFT_409174 [Chlamydoabsidia padenii]|nr:hypothetical protein BC941DRAFT_409174 [Chlamydoabsidia padenii]
MSLSIHLLPEFGWSVHDLPVFGPGSVFQGYVELELTEALTMDRLRLVFQGQERLVPVEIQPGVLRAKHIPLFCIQHILWDNKEGLRSLDVGHYKYPFTIQMPMIQYPPSMDDNFYNCTFSLIARVESQQQQSHYKNIITKVQRMTYMPFVETRLLKKPLTTALQQSDLHVITKLHSLGYLPGESILGSIIIHSTSTSTKPLHLSFSLYQTITCLSFEDVPPLTRMVASNNTIVQSIHLENREDSYSSSLTLEIPDILVPTFTYGKLITITYRLQLSVKRKGPLSMLSQEVKMDWPLIVGTLGSGVHSPYDLSIYSTSDGDEAYPIFKKTVEYEDALPLYESTRLPGYWSLPS